jgi:hypothetical protein
VKTALDRLASPRLTVPGLLVLGAGVAAAQRYPQAAAWLIAVPLALLALNLAAALATVRRLRRGGLGVFHGCLLACLLLVAWGRLTHLDGRVAITTGQTFDAASITIEAAGPWHGDGLRQLAFQQGEFQVTYAPQVRREHTRSTVALGGGPEPVTQVFGDDTPLVLDGYRFYTTSNKGFAPVLTWTPAGGQPVTGALMLPSYPLEHFQQMQEWKAPGGGAWKFWLRLPEVPENTAWTLDPARTRAALVAETAGLRHELQPGEEIRTPQGTLRYEFLSGWMGYRIFYDPTILPLLALSLLGVAGMAWHLWARSVRTLAAPEPLPA